ncbi:MAG: FliG C-terminal domain-containing protein [Phycisphaerae bacterium]|jgi:flagellar motor switch protein FliG
MTEVGRDIFKGLLSRARSLGTRRRIVIAMLLAAALAGVCWLSVGGGSDPYAAVDGKALPSADLAAAQATLKEQSIPCKSAGGKLLVPRSRLRSARAILAADKSDLAAGTTAFEDLARQDDIWRTAAQNDKRWQAAKMATLSKLVGMFPSVASATVIYEPGSEHRLGGGGEAATAAVRVTMKDGQALTRSSAMAIADLVVGSIAGMSPRNVRIIDSSGQSFRFDDSASGGDQDLRQRRELEAYYQEKIHEALRYVDKLVVGVSLAGKDGNSAMSVSIAVPRSYLRAANEHSGDGNMGPADAGSVDAAVAAQLARIRQNVARIVGIPESNINVDWYHDVAHAGLSGEDDAASAASGSGRAGGFDAVIAGLWAALGAALCIAIVRLRARKVRRSGRAVEPDARPGPASTSKGGAEAVATRSPRPFEFLEELSSEEIVSLIGQEHPQTIAIVLGQLSASRAAAVLSSLEGELQVASARRLAGLEQVDPVVVGEVERSMAQRAADLAAGRGVNLAGEERVAEILRQAGYVTERAVLSNLTEQVPALAESIRRRMFSFDDLVQLPAERLGKVLAGVAGEELAVALRTASGEVTAKVLSALPKSAAAAVAGEMERMGPVRLNEVEAAQQRVAEAARRMEMGQYVSSTTQASRQLLA